MPKLWQETQKSTTCNNTFKTVECLRRKHFFPPFGLIPAFKYLSQPDEKSKIVGIVAIVLTGITLIITVALVISLFNQLQSTLSSQAGSSDLYKLYGL